MKWFCWHGNVFRARQTIGDLQVDLDVEESGGVQVTLLDEAIREFDSCLWATCRFSLSCRCVILTNVSESSARSLSRMAID